MKHLILFEDLKKSSPKYKVGDYVHIDMEPDFDYDVCLAKIVDVDNNGFLIEPEDKESNDFNDYINKYNPFPYSVKFYKNGWNVEENLIDRYLTEDEIVYFNFLIKHGTEIKKFNL